MVNYTSQNTYRTDLAVVPPGSDGTISIRNGGAGPVDIVREVEGWFAYMLGPKPDEVSVAGMDNGSDVSTTGSDPTPRTEIA
ncbi:MAG TPA: hypothetical protein VHO01_07870 [Jatrophihabitans sp.]|nr:hypothetical protein [Jatrophihabitans sp.]